MVTGGFASVLWILASHLLTTGADDVAPSSQAVGNGTLLGGAMKGLEGDVAWMATLAFSSLVVAATAVALYTRKTSSGKHGKSAHASSSEDTTTKKRVSVLYGTQTGTAERFAKQLAVEINAKFGAAKAEAVDIEFYDTPAQLPEETLALFCVATYGDGEPTDSMTSFCEWLEASVGASDKDGSQPLKELNFGVFALGNRQYEHFCACGKQVDRQLAALGASRIVARGDGDDDQNIEDDFAAWKLLLWKALAAESGLGASDGDDAGTVVAAPVAEECKVRFLAKGARPVDPWAGLAPAGRRATAQQPVKATVAVRRELHTGESDRSCIHAELDISGALGKALAYETGDHVGIFASNPPWLVEEALRRLRWDGDAVVKVEPAPSVAAAGGGKREAYYGKPVAVRTLLSDFCDLQSPPRKDALAALAATATDPMHRFRLERLSRPDGKADYAKYVQDPQRSLVEVLEDFPSCEPSLACFLSRIAPRLLPRYYSISSSPLAHPNRIHITCAVVQGVSPTGREHLGVASTWLARAVPGKSVVAAFVRTSTFRLPKQVGAPLIMVGPGTGFAPFRGFLQEMESKAAGAAGFETYGESRLFFGCRDRNKDYIYREELEAWRDSGVLHHLDVAFSREQKHKVYVQDKMRTQGAALWSLIEDGAHIYVCGDAKMMAKDVNKVLHDLIQVHGKRTKEEAEAILIGMVKQGRYLRDVW